MSIGPYRIIEALGSGANGEVYLAEDLRLGRKVAIKTLSALGSTKMSDARRWMLREARAAARLNHPHIASVYDVVESPQGAHIVMEYVRGEPLASRVREGPLPPGQVLEIATQLADALAEAHGMGVVHRDLKPANVVLTPKGDVKILDFGLAQVRPVEPGSSPVRSSRDFSLDGRQIGTPPYMPPEHLMGDPVDARGDIYSLGVMLYELLTGRRPFRGADAMKLTMAILTEPTPKASGSNPAVPEALDAVVLRAMSRLPQDRYASAAEMAEDLRRAAAGVAAKPLPIDPQRVESEVPTVSRPRLWPLRLGDKQRTASLASLATIAALAVYVAISRGRVPIVAQSTGPPVLAVLPLTGVTSDPQDEALATGIADSLISALSRLPDLTVVSRQATLPYRDRKKDTATIARELGATVVVDGGLQRSGENVRVSISLLRAEFRTVEWSNTYDGSLREAFTLQSQVADALVDRLRLSVSAVERQRLQQPPTTNLEAFADYSQARAFLERPDVPGNLLRSVELFQSAIAKDARFAQAYAGLGAACWNVYTETREASWSLKAHDATEKALQLDPSDGWVRYSLALIYRDTGRAADAIDELHRAISLQPGNDAAHAMLGGILLASGKWDDGVTELRKAISLRPTYWGHYHALAVANYNVGRYPEAISALRRETELQPDSARAFQTLGTVYQAMGDTSQAVINYERALRLGPDARAYTNLGTIYYEQGRFDDALRAYQEAARLEPNTPAKHRNLGDVYTKLGRKDRARQAYLRAIEISEDQLRLNPANLEARAALAVYKAKIGRCSEATRQAAAAISPAASGAVFYRQAVAFALCGDHARGLASLNRAFQRGYSRALADKDEDLSVLRNNPDYPRPVDAGPQTGAAMRKR